MTTNSKQPRTPEQAQLSHSKAALAAKPGHDGIDPRGPRFGAGITAVLLLIALLFAWGAFVGIKRHPYGLLYKSTLRRWLNAPSHLEDPRPPTFSQGVGFAVTVIGIVLHLAAVPYALVILAAMAFIAAFLNSVFDYCVGCQIYVLLVRAGLVGRRRSES